MSFNRINPKAGWTNKRTGLCRNCGQNVKRFDSRKQTFCCNECVKEWKIKSDPVYARRLVLKRDKGICTCCGRDTLEIQKQIEIIRTRYGTGSTADYIEQLFFEQQGLDPMLHRKTFYDADHIKPVSQGGGECGLEGLRLLCLWCHAKATHNLKLHGINEPEI
jgi:hypothetical protein